MSIRHYYVVIVGSGPAGLGVAELLRKNPTLSAKTLILEKGNPLEERTCPARQGKKCAFCNPCNVLSGVGGAGPYTDGKICLYQQDLRDLFRRSEENDNNDAVMESIDRHLRNVQRIWKSHGAGDLREVKVSKEVGALRVKSYRHGVKFIRYPVLHIGSDGAIKVISHYISELQKAGIEVREMSEVVSVKRVQKVTERFQITYTDRRSLDGTKTKEVTADVLVLALGRNMQRPAYIDKLLPDLEVKFKPKNLEIGCRVEVPCEIMEDATQTTFDPKFELVTRTYQDKVRTFCTCHKGKVVREGPCVNGHTDKNRLTHNTNFALLVRWPLDGLILDDAMDYGNTIAKLTLSQGKGRPIIQRIVDLVKGVPSTSDSIRKSYIKPTLRLDHLVTPGDISACYPRRIVVDLCEGLQALDKVIEGIGNDQNLLYAPEIKPTCSVRLKDGVKTPVSNLYVCGDFSGYTRGIAQAMCMGMMVGEDILRGT